MNRAQTRLLVVDDSESMRRSVRNLLHTFGFPLIDEASDGAEALELFERTAYDLVLTDWQMPRLDGLELVRAIRQHPVRSQTPVLVLTGHVNSERVQEALGAGATGFVAKPFEIGSLCEKVLAALGLLPPVSPRAYEEARLLGR